MFFHHKPLIWYLSNSSVRVLVGETQHEFHFPSELVQHGEIVDERAFSKALTQFIDTLQIATKNGVIYLAPEIVYTTEQAVDLEHESSQIQQFLWSVPVGQAAIATVMIRTKDKLKLFATNRKLYEALIQTCGEMKIEIRAVVPAAEFSKNNRAFLTQYDFLHSKQVESEEAHDSSEKVELDPLAQAQLRKQYVVLMLTLLLLGGAIVFLLLWTGVLVNPWFSTNV